MVACAQAAIPFVNEGWQVVIADLSKICALQPHINTDRAIQRLNGLQADDHHRRLKRFPFRCVAARSRETADSFRKLRGMPRSSSLRKPTVRADADGKKMRRPASLGMTGGDWGDSDPARFRTARNRAGLFSAVPTGLGSWDRE
jgi:hypothetical protein